MSNGDKLPQKHEPTVVVKTRKALPGEEIKAPKRGSRSGKRVMPRKEAVKLTELELWGAAAQTQPDIGEAAETETGQDEPLETLRQRKRKQRMKVVRRAKVDGSEKMRIPPWTKPALIVALVVFLSAFLVWRMLPKGSASEQVMQATGLETRPSFLLAAENVREFSRLHSSVFDGYAPMPPVFNVSR